MIAAYGLLYNWYAVDNALGLATNGSVPTDAQFTQLTDYIIATYPEIDSTNIGDALKSIRQVNSPYLAESDKYIKPKVDELTGEQRLTKAEYVEGSATTTDLESKVTKAETFNEGTLKKFDSNGNDADSGLTGESLDIYDVSSTVINELTTENNWLDIDGNPILTPIILSGGVKGQRYYSNDYFYECVSDFNWRRTFIGRPIIDIYNNPNLTLTDKSNLENASNWSSKVYIGPAIENVAAGTRYYDNDYIYEFVQTNLPIRYSRI